MGHFPKYSSHIWIYNRQLFKGSMRTLRIAPIIMLLFVTFLAASCGPAKRASGATAPATTPGSVAHGGTSVAAGQLAWKFKAGDNAGEAAISGGLVYMVGNDGKQPEDKRFAASLHALDAASGTERWKFAMPGDEVGTAPAVSRGLVYVGTLHGYVYALDAATGIQRWKRQIGLQVDLSSPAVSGDLVYVAGSGGGGGGQICALDAATGAARWKFQTDLEIMSSPVVSAGLLYIADNSGSGAGILYALDAATGAERWKVNVGDTHDSVAVSGGLVYVGSMDSNMNGCLQALDGATGTERWKLALPPPGAPTVSGGLVYFGGSDAQNTGDYIYAMDAATRAQRWKTQTAGWAASAPVVSGGLVYVEEDGGLYALDAASGAQRWKFGLASGYPAVVSKGLVYVAGQDGYEYAVTTGTAALMNTGTSAPWTDSALAR